VIPSDDDDGDDVQVASTLDEALAQLQGSFPDAKFGDLKAALTKANGEYGLAAAFLASRDTKLFDLSNAQPSANDQAYLSHNTQNSRLNRLIHKPSSFKAVSMPIESDPVPSRKRAQSVESDVASDDSGDSYDESGRNTFNAQDRKEERALEFFNEATLLELRELTGCSKTQATGVISLRPFDNFDQLCVTLRKTKGVGEKIVNSYLTTTDAIRAVDMMLKTVDRVREDLVGTLSVWCGDETGKLFESGTNSNKLNTETTDSADGRDEEDDEPGMGLLDVDVDKALTTPEGRAAMKHFIRRQPRNMAAGFQLKGYQLLGINWLALLWRKKLSGILADEVSSTFPFTLQNFKELLHDSVT
jgi:DNA uptake protein ComE-like DNA-binding protein